MRRFGAIWAILAVSLVIGGCDRSERLTAQNKGIVGYVDRVVSAIYRAEGAERASVPYGMVNDRYCMDEPGMCRYLARVTVQNTLKRWELAGKPKEFIAFLGDRYCPVGADNDNGSNRHWISNVRYFMEMGS